MICACSHHDFEHGPEGSDRLCSLCLCDNFQEVTPDIGLNKQAALKLPHENWEFDDGSRWELGDTMAGGAHKDSMVMNGEMVPGFITMRIISSNGDEQEHRYALAPADPVEYRKGDWAVEDGEPTPFSSADLVEGEPVAWMSDNGRSAIEVALALADVTDPQGQVGDALDLLAHYQERDIHTAAEGEGAREVGYPQEAFADVMQEYHRVGKGYQWVWEQAHALASQAPAQEELSQEFLDDMRDTEYKIQKREDPAQTEEKP